jgi:hypothetical protein
VTPEWFLTNATCEQTIPTYRGGGPLERLTTKHNTLVGANASLYINLGTSTDSNAGPISGNSLTFLHKLYP